MLEKKIRLQYIGRPIGDLKFMGIYIIDENKNGALKFKDTNGLYLPFDVTEQVNNRPPYTYSKIFVRVYTKEEQEEMKKKAMEQYQELITLEKYKINLKKRNSILNNNR